MPHRDIAIAVDLAHDSNAMVTAAYTT